MDFTIDVGDIGSINIGEICIPIICDSCFLRVLPCSSFGLFLVLFSLYQQLEMHLSVVYRKKL